MICSPLSPDSTSSNWTSDRLQNGNNSAAAEPDADPLAPGAFVDEPADHAQAAVGAAGQAERSDKWASTTSRARFGLELGDADQLLFDQFEESWAGNEQLAARARNNDFQNFRLVFDRTFLDTVVRRMDDNEEIFKRILDEPDFQQTILDHYATRLYERLRREDDHARARPGVAALGGYVPFTAKVLNAGGQLPVVQASATGHNAPRRLRSSGTCRLVSHQTALRRTRFWASLAGHV
jgi:hypothetical protein